MKFIAEKCECCEDIALGIECSIEDLQRTEDGKMFLTMDRDDVSTVFSSISDHLRGLPTAS